MADKFGLRIGLEGEREFKKALSEINRSFKVLGSEMKLVTSQFDKNDKSVQALSARNTVLNKEIETQKQKIETLKSALENAASSFGENDRRTQNWQIQLNHAEAALNSMERELDGNNQALKESEEGFDKAGDEAEDFGKEIAETGHQSEKAGQKLKQVGEVAKTVGKALAAAAAAIGAAAIAAGKKLWDMSNDVAEAGDEIDKMSQKIGISKKAYQEWSYVFERSGADINIMQGSMKKLSEVITEAADGSASAAEKLSAVGLSIEDLNNKSQDEQLSIVISALQDMESGSERTAAASALLGRSATELGAVLNMTAEETEALKQEASDYGMIMSDEAVAASAAFEDSLTRLNRSMGGVKKRMVGELLPGITLIMDGLSDLVAGNDLAGKEIQEGVSSVLETISSMIPQAVEFIGTIAAAVLESAPSIISALGEGIIGALPLLMPVVLNVITELVGALMTLLPEIIEAGMQIIVTLAQGIAEALPTLIPQIVVVMTQIVETLIENLPLLLDAALELIKGLAEGLLAAIPELISALPLIIKAIVDFIIGSIPEMIQAGIDLLTALITALPEIITAIVTAIPEIITAIVEAILDNIPLIIQAGVDLLISLVKNLPQIIAAVVGAIPQIVGELISAIIGSIPKIVKAGFDLFVSLIKNLPQMIVNIVKAVPQIISGIVKAFGSSMYKIVEVGGQIVKGLWQGIKSLASWLWDKVTGWISGIWGGIKNFFGISSPSKEMAWIGEMLVKGLAGSIETSGDEAISASEDLARDINDVMHGLGQNMETAIPTDFELQTKHTVAPLERRIGFSEGTGPLIKIEQMFVRSDDDIRKVSQELYNLLEAGSRAQGRFSPT